MHGANAGNKNRMGEEKTFFAEKADGRRSRRISIRALHCEYKARHDAVRKCACEEVKAEGERASALGWPAFPARSARWFRNGDDSCIPSQPLLLPVLVAFPDCCTRSAHVPGLLVNTGDKEKC